MSLTVYLAMFGWIPFVIYLFRWVPAQRAVIVSFIIAWLFLPVVQFTLPGPDYTKMSATCYGILLATILFDVKRFSSLQLEWLDLPMVVWCLCPLASSLQNDLGIYDGFSAVFEQITTWGLPYYLGRLYLSNLEGIRKLAVDIFIGGLVYIPFCLFEIRMSPQLHRIVYGFHARSDFGQTICFGGYRPTVFMEHGLMVGAWMMAATLIGIWLWRCGAIASVWGISVNWLVAALLLTTLLLKSTGAIILLLLGLLVLFLSSRLRTSVLVWILIGAISLYLYLGVTGKIPKDPIIHTISTTIDQQRAQSVQFRFDNEKLLSQKAREKIVFGWGGWGRSRVYDRWGKDISVTDSLWIITFGTKGLVGLVSLITFLLLPAIAAMRTYPASRWNHPQVAPVAAMALLLVLYTIDCLLNAMINPIYVLGCGALSGLVLLHKNKANKKFPAAVADQKTIANNPQT